MVASNPDELLRREFNELISEIRLYFADKWVKLDEDVTNGTPILGKTYTTKYSFIRKRFILRALNFFSITAYMEEDKGVWSLKPSSQVFWMTQKQDYTDIERIIAKHEPSLRKKFELGKFVFMGFEFDPYSKK